MTATVSSADTGPIQLNESEEVRNILQNIRMILRTPRGSVPMYRDFGLDWSFLDRPTSQAQIMVIPLVREAVELWEPRVTVKSVTLSKVDTNGAAKIDVEVEFSANGV